MKNDDPVKNSIWNLVTIEEVNSLPGKSIYEIIQIILKVIDFKYVVLDDIEGALVASLLDIQDDIIEVKELMPLLCSVKQFDWGDFFLFKSYPTTWDNPKKELYPYVIAQTDTTVRAIDDGYIYVYTPYKAIVDLIKENYDIESLTTGALEELSYPE